MGRAVSQDHLDRGGFIRAWIRETMVHARGGNIVSFSPLRFGEPALFSDFYNPRGRVPIRLGMREID